MRSLRARIVVLSALMALGSAIICAVAAMQVAQGNLSAMENRQADEALASLHKRIRQACDGLAYEVDDYGNWDELHAQMPLPDSEWARINLTPGKIRGALTQFMITGDQQRITGRYRDGDVRGAQPSVRDPASPSALALLLGHPQPLSGLTVLAGNPALYAVTPVRPSNRQGEPRGHLIGLAYLDEETLARLQPDGWVLGLEVDHNIASAAPGAAAMTWDEARIGRDAKHLRVSTAVATHDGILRVMLTTDRTAGRRIGDHTTAAILVAGLCAAAIALLVGTWLGWRWLAPISALAKACQQQLDDPHAKLPENSGLVEADLLSDSMHQLIMRLRVGQDELAHALDRESVTNAVHRRFLTQLGHEFGQPIRRIIALCEQMERRAGHLDPEEVAAAKHLANELEQRFQEILGLVALEQNEALPNRPLGMHDYLSGLAELMRPQAEKAGITIRVDAPPDAVQLDPALLSPVLINLCANALRAGSSGDQVLLQGRLDRQHGESQWTVQDNGPGLPEALADRLREAFTRGEVLPGTPGIGMGLTLALANVRTLGGSLVLLNRTEPGVTIVIRLPLPDGDQEQTMTASERIRRRR
jgi:signal transduction histidine kinase